MPTSELGYQRTADEENLVRRLRVIREDGNAIGTDEISHLAAEIIKHIGSPDPELRDELGSTTLAEWIVERDALPSEQLLGFLRDRLGNEGIGFHLGESGADSVFQRSFSLLVLALIVAADNRREFLSREDLQQVAEGLITYCKLESDFRSRVSKRGWAHAMAHAADLADECMRNRNASRELAGQIVEALAAMVQRSDRVFSGEEEERIAIALTALTPKDSASALKQWIDAHASQDEATRINWKNIVRSLYFRTDESEMSARLVLAALQEELCIHG